MRKIYRTQTEAEAAAAARSTDGAKWVIHCHAHPSGCYWTVSPNRATRRTQKNRTNEKRKEHER